MVLVKWYARGWPFSSGRRGKIDHIASKVDALLAKFDKLSVNAASSSTPSSSSSCEICGVVGHIGTECQLGASTAGSEQANFAQKGDHPKSFPSTSELTFIKHSM